MSALCAEPGPLAQAIDFRVKAPMRDTDSDVRIQVPPDLARYNELYAYEDALNLPLAVLDEDMRDHRLAPSLIHAEHEWGPDEPWNDRAAALLHGGERFVSGFACVNPALGMGAVREIERAYHELGLRGVTIQPGINGISPVDPLCYPVYSKCVELGMPIGIHTGINFSARGTFGFGRPVLVDQVACAFPELVIICWHGGWPWPHEAAGVAWKHPNVYLEFGAISPRYQAAGSGGGWGDIARLMDTVLRKQILFGSDWPMLRYSRIEEDVHRLGLRSESMDDYLRGNARRLIERVLD